MRRAIQTAVLLLACGLAAFGQATSNCDLNTDGFTNVVDVQLLINEALGITQGQHDLNRDGLINVADVQAEINAALGLGCLADPTVSDFNPRSGPIGTSVTITGTNFGTSPQVSMPAQGGGTIIEPVSTSTPTSITFQLVAGTTTGKLTITSGTTVGVSALSFTVTASSTFSLSAAPPAATVIRGQSVSYALTLDSPNGFTQLADLSVTSAPAGLTTSLKPTSITAGQTAVLTVTAPAGQPVSGPTPLTVKAAATVDGVAITQTAPLTLAVAPVTTTFIGRTVVDDTQQTPLAGITVYTLGKDGGGANTGCTGHSVASDAAGNFALTNLPASCIGPQLIGFSGDTATSPPGTYAGVNLIFTLVPNQVVVSPVLVHMPRIDGVETFFVQQNSASDQTYVFTTIPGLKVTVYAGTTLKLADGTFPNPFPLKAIDVPVDRLPEEMPRTNSMVTAFIVAFQPANTTANKPVAIWFPNTLNTPPGTGVPLMTLDPTRGSHGGVWHRNCVERRHHDYSRHRPAERVSATPLRHCELRLAWPRREPAARRESGVRLSRPDPRLGQARGPFIGRRGHDLARPRVERQTRPGDHRTDLPHTQFASACVWNRVEPQLRLPARHQHAAKRCTGKSGVANRLPAFPSTCSQTARW